jgi:hypothetical protein
MLFAITSYFNPVGYRRRLQNYRAFRQRLSVPLVTVELSFSGEFELSESDAEHLIQVRATDVMFQKERLLNLAIKALPAACDAVAWLDCDVMLGDGWQDLVVDRLCEFALVQLYQDQFNLSPDYRPDSPGGGTLFGTAVAKKLATGEMTMKDFTAEAAPVTRTAWGLAWAARRDLLDAHGLYDACILGSGDAAMVSAAVGGFGRAREALCMSEKRYQHYLRWARPFHDEVRGKLGYLPLEILHLWHGDMHRRRYRERHQDMVGFDFDPAVDISLTEEGCWRWNSPKPALHAFVAEYFRSRREDEASGESQ